MEQEITIICNADLKKGVFTNAQFIFCAESGAMGTPGEVLIVTSGGSIFCCNYCYGDINLNKLYRSLPVLKACDFGLFGEGTKIPDKWEHQYLGAGNHLLIRSDVYADFKEALGNAKYPEEIFLPWFDAAWNIIEKQNNGKLPFETKTPEELALLMNKAISPAKPMTEEGLIEDDAEGGYFEDD